MEVSFVYSACSATTMGYSQICLYFFLASTIHNNHTRMGLVPVRFDNIRLSYLNGQYDRLLNHPQQQIIQKLNINTVYSSSKSKIIVTGRNEGSKAVQLLVQ